MATARMVARDRVRKRLSENSRFEREALRKIIKDKTVGYDEKALAVQKLNKEDRDRSQCRVRRRCTICGRPRGVYQKFSLCRMCLRKAVMFGHVPGVRKASW